MIRYLLLLIIFCSSLWAQETSEPAEIIIETPEVSRERNRREIVTFGASVTIGTNEYAQDVVVFGGNTKVHGEIRGDLIVIGGKVIIDGPVKRDVVCIGAEITITTNAFFERDVVLIGGTIDEAEGVTYERGRQHFPIALPVIHLQWLQDWFQYGLLIGRPLPHQLPWAWVIAGIFLLIYLAAGIVFRGTTTKAAINLVEKPMQSFGFGVLTLVLVGPVLFLLVVSVVGILAAPFLLCGLIVVAIIGKAAVLQSIGSRLGIQNTPALAILAGGILLALLYAIPVLGFIAFAMASVMGLGAVLVPMFAGKPMTPVPIPVQPLQPPPIAPIAPEVPVLPPVATESVYQPAGFWLKFAGAFLDLLIITVFTAITTFPPAGLLLWLGYNTAFWATKGTTLGGMVVGIKAVRLDGTKVTFAVAAVRALSSVLSLMPLCLGFIWSAWDSRKQTWHDKIAGTMVVKVPAGVSLL